MALFNRQNNNDIPPELQPYYDAPAAPRKNWLGWIVRGIAFIVLVALIAILVRWSWHEARGNAKDTAPSVSTSQGKVGSSNGSQTSDSSKNADNKPTDTSKSTDNSTAKSQSAPSSSTPSTPPKTQTPPASTPAPTAAAPANQTTLTNTGPGSLVGVVTAAVLGGVILYQYALRTKLKN